MLACTGFLHLFPTTHSLKLIPLYNDNTIKPEMTNMNQLSFIELESQLGGVKVIKHGKTPLKNQPTG